MDSKNRINWTGHFIELLIVTSGILIAFGLNSWRETQREEALSQLYLDGIIEELKSNKEELESKLEYHTGLLDQLRESPRVVRMMLRPAVVSNAAWKLSENDIFKRYVDQDQYKKIVAVYQIHDGLVRHARESSNYMGELNVFAPLYLLGASEKLTNEDRNQIFTMVRQGWIPIFEDWTNYERIYIEKIDEFLSTVSDQSGQFEN